MNYNKLHAIIDFYVENEGLIHTNNLEGYKWTILSSIRSEIITYVKRHYNNKTWDQDFSDFYEFTRKTIGKTGNLVYSSSRSVMQRAADKYPKLVRQMFIDLSGMNSDISLENRIAAFIDSIETLAQDPDISKSKNSFHKDYRSVSVYLLMMNPEKYYSYMKTTFVAFADFIEFNISKTNCYLIEYYRLCDEIQEILRKEYKEWFENYLQIQKDGDLEKNNKTDINGHLLVQDIIFSLYYYNHPDILEELKESIIVPRKFTEKPIRIHIKPGEGAFVDYGAQEKQNRHIGTASENFVFENERRLVVSYGFDPNRVQHVSKEIGDGLGYDILSCDEKGEDIYIEVKGTKGKMGTTFYITETELQCSKLHADKYRLYRVYDFKIEGTTGRGKIAVIKGSLEPYCLNPISYRVVFQ